VIASLIYSSVLESRSEDATFNSRTGQTKPRHDGGEYHEQNRGNE